MAAVVGHRLEVATKKHEIDLEVVVEKLRVRIIMLLDEMKSSRKLARHSKKDADAAKRTHGPKTNTCTNQHSFYSI